MYLDYVVSEGETDEYALSAAQHIDILTYFRIKDFSKLTEFQQNMIDSVHNGLTNFERENQDILISNLTSYSINGTSMQFGQKLKEIGGITIPAEIYTLLCSTGLCYPAI